MIANISGYKLGTRTPSFTEQVPGHTLSVTFVLTEDCNLACGYCYMVGKNKKSRMTFETAKKAVDYILTQEFPHRGVIWEFIGGEPLLEIELLSRTADYIVKRMWELRHKWFDYYAFSISTNGVLYDKPEVQQFINTYRNHLSLGITIDGTREKHNMHRKFPNGTGSYDVVAKNVKLWLEQFPPKATTKVTFSSDDLPHLKESIIHLWDLGIINVPANVVFEDVWKEGDDQVLEQQLRELADYAIESGRWKTHVCTLFDDGIGHPVSKEEQDQNWCGSGAHMIAVNHEGKLYPCIRFMDYSLTNKKGICLGDLDHGIDQNRLRPFYMLTGSSQSTEECLKCEVASGCAWCQGLNYDCATIDTMFARATFICKMHKARVRANQYYFARLARMQKASFNRETSKTLYLMLSDDAAPICKYVTRDRGGRMSSDLFRSALRFAQYENFFPVLLQPRDQFVELPDVPGWHAVPAQHRNVADADIVVFENGVDSVTDKFPQVVLIIDRPHLGQLATELERVLPVSTHVSVQLRRTDEYTPEDLSLYEKQLGLVSEKITEWSEEGKRVSLNLLTDRHSLQSMKNCEAGSKSFALAPNGLLYICPAFYYDEPSTAVGSLETGIDWSKVELCQLRKAPLCSSVCTAYHCNRCVFENKLQTGELNIPGRSQCISTHLELKESARLLGRISSDDRQIDVEYVDPFQVIWDKTFSRREVLS